MRSVSRLWVFALLVFSIGGCNEVITPTTAPFGMIISSFDVEQNRLGGPLDGVEICEIDTTANCMMTDAKGEATLMLPIGETGYTVTREGYGAYLFGIVMRTEGQIGARFIFPTDDWAIAIHEATMSPFPMRGTGTVQIGIDPGFAGVTFELDGATGKPYYFDDDGPNPQPNADLTATTDRGFGGFTEVSPGEFRAVLAGTASGCVASVGWPSDPNSVRFPVREGYITYPIFACPLP